MKQCSYIVVMDSGWPCQQCTVWPILDSAFLLTPDSKLLQTSNSLTRSFLHNVPGFPWTLLELKKVITLDEMAVDIMNVAKALTMAEFYQWGSIMLMSKELIPNQFTFATLIGLGLFCFLFINPFVLLTFTSCSKPWYVFSISFWT